MATIKATFGWDSIGCDLIYASKNKMYSLRNTVRLLLVSIQFSVVTLKFYFEVKFGNIPEEENNIS